MPFFKRSGDQASDESVLLSTAAGRPLAMIPTSVNDQAQYLWTRLQVHGDELPRSIAVTSQLSGEGVSFASLSLATMLSRSYSVCMVEANWWGTGLPAADDDTNPGLAGVLSGSAQLNDALVQTDRSQLWILPAGNIGGTTTPVAFNTAMITSLLEGLRAMFDVVVLDLPAITTSATTLTFAAAADASLLVVRQGVTTVEQVESAIAELKHTWLLGVVLNANKISTPRVIRQRLLEA